MREGLSPTTIGIVIFIVAVVGLRVIAPGAFMAVTRPLWGLGTALDSRVRAVRDSFGNSVALNDQVRSQGEQITNLENENQLLQSKVNDLTQLLGSRSDVSSDILAAVWARPPVAPYDTLVIDRGSADGIDEHAAVYGNGGVPIGTITSVTDHAAHVTLYSSSGVATSALIGATHIPVTITGLGGGAFSATAPRNSGIQVGDAVYASGPGSLPIGNIAAVDADPASPMETLHVRPLIQPFSITWVTVSTQNP